MKEVAPILDLVWKYDPASNVSLRYWYTALEGFEPRLLAVKLSSGRKISLVDRLVFRERPSRSDEGKYTCTLQVKGTERSSSINLTLSIK